MQDNLFQGTEFLQQVLDTMPNAIYYKDAYGMYRGCNRVFEELIGWRKEDVIGRTDYEIMPRALADEYYQMDARLLNSSSFSGSLQEFEADIKTRKGEIHKASFHKSVFRDKSGKVLGLIGIILDLTVMQKAEATKVTELIRSSIAERISLISTITSGAINEMNIAINDIQKVSDSFTFWHNSGKVLSTELIIAQIAKINENIKKMKKVSKHLRSFVEKRKNEELEAVNVNQVIASAADILGSELKKKGITLKADLTGNIPMVSANVGKLEEIFINILIFAIRATEMQDMAQKKIQITSKFRVPDLSVQVSYPGKKKTTKELAMVFDPIFTEGKTTDMSITMAIVKSMIEDYKGKIELNNTEDGSGLVFDIVFHC